MNFTGLGGSWFAIHVRQRYECLVATILQSKGYEGFTPLTTASGHNGRRSKGKLIARPLYPGYVFCRFDGAQHAPIVTTPGVIRIVGNGNTPVAIGEQEIANIQTIERSQIPARPFSYLATGDLVRINEGPLRGTEGVLLRVKNAGRLVVSVDLLRRSNVVELQKAWVESAVSRMRATPTAAA